MPGHIYIFSVMILSLCAFSVAAGDPYLRNTSEEKQLIDSFAASTPCSCEGALILYKNHRITMKGCFQKKKLICGVECKYDSDTLLVSVYKYVDGKPADSLKVRLAED